MTLQALLAYVSLWLLASAITLIVFRFCLDYLYEDLPATPWLRRLVLAWYFPLCFLLFGGFALMDRCEKDERLPVFRPFLRIYWRQFKDPLGDHGHGFG